MWGTPKRLILWSEFLLATFLLVCPVFQAAHSRRRQVIRLDLSPKYDRSITTFSPEGRLLQVEYGMEASSRGEIVAAILHPDGVVFAIGSKAAPEKVHRIDAHVYMITVGLGPDARFLASNLRIACQNFRLTNGEAPTVKEVATIAAQMQHDLTKTGGTRPLGCTALIAGIDPCPVKVGANGDNHSFVGELKLFQTDPGGIVEECFYCAAGKSRSQVMKELGNLQERVRPIERKSLHETALNLALSVIGVKDKALESPDSISVWIIRPYRSRRGGAETVWIDHINRSSAKQLTFQLENL